MNVNKAAIQETTRVFKMNVSRTGTLVRGTLAAGLIGQILLFDGTLLVQVPFALLGTLLGLVAILRWDPLIALFEWLGSSLAESPPLRIQPTSWMSREPVSNAADHRVQSASNDGRFGSDSRKVA